WSYVGTDCLSVPEGQATMNLGFLTSQSSETDYSTYVLHEFGHALGFIHEHQNPNANIPWNEPEVYKYFTGPPQFWSQEQVRYSVLDKYGGPGSYGRDFDPSSIMMYPFPAKLFRGYFETRLNTRLSRSDRELARQLYPFPSPAENLIVGIASRQMKVNRAGE